MAGGGVLVWMLGLCCLVVGFWAIQGEKGLDPKIRAWWHPTVTEARLPYRPAVGISVFDVPMEPHYRGNAVDVIAANYPASGGAVDSGVGAYRDSLSLPFMDVVGLIPWLFWKGIVFGENHERETDFQDKCRRFANVRQFATGFTLMGQNDGVIRTRFNFGYNPSSLGDDHVFGLSFSRARLDADTTEGAGGDDAGPACDYSKHPVWYVCRGVEFMPLIRLGIFALFLFGGTLWGIDSPNAWRYRLGMGLVVAGFLIGFAPVPWDLGIRYGYPQEDGGYCQSLEHSRKTVPPATLTSQWL